MRALIPEPAVCCAAQRGCESTVTGIVDKPYSYSVTPQNPQKNHSRQHFWPHLSLGRWVKGLSCGFGRFQTIMNGHVDNAHGESLRCTREKRVGRFDFRGGILDHRTGGASQAHLRISVECRLPMPNFAREHFAPGRVCSRNLLPTCTSGAAGASRSCPRRRPFSTRD